MNGPQKKGGGSANAAHKLPFVRTLLEPFAEINDRQFASWKVEAWRLLLEYWRSGRTKHLNAFNIHFCAMRVHCADSLAEQVLRFGGGVL
jgi:hypothetical protein